MKKAIEMPEVMQCDAQDCAYNRDNLCHARGITIGNMDQQLCDTMWPANMRTSREGGAGVGACRSANCAFNEDLECQADGINVMMSGSKARCGTFAPRRG